MASAENAATGLGDDDMPALCRSFSRSAQAAQRDYLWFRKVLLVVLVLTGVTGAIEDLVVDRVAAEHVSEVQRTAAVLVAILFASSLAFELKQRADRKPEDWYSSRALAESTRSMAWKYAMRADPYQADDADGLFSRDLRRLLADARVPLSANADGEQITARMRQVRAGSYRARLAIYQRDRIGHQRTWYSARSSANNASNTRIQTATTLTLVLALGSSIIAIRATDLGAIATIATALAPCLIAWNQTKQHRELAHAYSFTGHEIGIIAAAAAPANDDDLGRFVADCETAFSREHTMWRARREKAEG